MRRVFGNLLIGSGFMTIVCCSCVNKNETDNCYKIFKKENLESYTFLHGINKSDTLLFVIKSNFYKNNLNCISLNSNMIKIEKLFEGKKTIYFTQKISVSGRNFKIESGIAPPGKENKFKNSYSSFPYLIKY